MLNFGDSLPLRVTFVSFAIQAARMSTPGAAISGCKARRQENNLFTHIPRIFFEREEGPLDEKYAIVGAGLYCDTTVLGRIVATGFLGNYKIYQETSL
ncbi:hypothetical protein SADUNF_Sadunf02G0015600 [Salix dunnii]|uniref:Uncharacterized protein n=1 Tax=Salix dunnii TaxID=1413687 RepID=A0A835N5I0_9ROSI|nr:hypothetical protein SADUNF_Sadunf02G0015600 [Salix dunnii]